MGQGRSLTIEEAQRSIVFFQKKLEEVEWDRQKLVQENIQQFKEIQRLYAEIKKMQEDRYIKLDQIIDEAARRIIETFPGTQIAWAFSEAPLELRSVQSELESAQLELRSVRSELKAAQSKLKSTRSELRSAQSELESAQSKLKSVMSQLSGTQSLNAQLIWRNKGFTKENERLVEEYKISADAIRDQREEFQQLQKEIVRLTLAIGDLNKEASVSQKGLFGEHGKGIARDAAGNVIGIDAGLGSSTNKKNKTK